MAESLPKLDLKDTNMRRISINDEIWSWFLRKPLKSGDLVKVDMCIDLKKAGSLILAVGICGG